MEFSLIYISLEKISFYILLFFLEKNIGKWNQNKSVLIL